jgi:hypothetical protein
MFSFPTKLLFCSLRVFLKKLSLTEGRGDGYIHGLVAVVRTYVQFGAALKSLYYL